MRYISIVNLNKHQHYKDRNPPWIKLHQSVLSDYAFSRLQDASKAHLMLLWLLASRLDNKIPYDLDWIGKQVGATRPVDLEVLTLHGFIEVGQDDSISLALSKQSAMPETEESRVETEKSTTTGYSENFEIAWKAYPQKAGGNSKADAWKAYKARLREGTTAPTLLAGVDRYAKYIRATGKERSEYVKLGATFFGPSRHWAEPWTLPITPKKLTEQDRNAAVLDAYLARKEAANG